MANRFVDNSAEIMAAVNGANLRGLERCGLKAEGYAKKEITRQKAVDTGNLRNSITHEVVPAEKAVYIGTNVEYAAYVECGTAKMDARPYLKPSIANHAKTYQRIFADELKG